MTRIFFSIFLLGLLKGSLVAQMINGTDTLYGNEWIDFAKTYYRVKVARDGIYRIGYQQMADQGIPMASVPGSALRLYAYGKQVPLYVSTSGPMGSSDYVEFYGERNRDVIDRYMYTNPDAENLNPWYSLFNDTTAYYLTWTETGTAERFQAAANDLSNPPAPETYCWSNTPISFQDYSFKRSQGFDVAYSWYDGDGFGNGDITASQVNLAAPQALAGGPAATVYLRYGVNQGLHQTQIKLNDSIFDLDLVNTFKIFGHQYTVPSAYLTQGLNVSLQSQGGQTDRHTLAGAELRYARTFNFGGAASALFELDASATGHYLEITGIDLSGGQTPVLYDLSNRLRLQPELQGNVWRVKLPPSTVKRRIWVGGNAVGVTPASELVPRQFHNFSAENAGYVIITNPVLRQDATAGNADHVQAYADYRASMAGGSFNTAIVDINELYEQFAYGIRYHALSVRNFCYYLKKISPAPRYILLIGKGLDYKDFRTNEDRAALLHNVYFLPTYGSPSSDLEFVMSGNRIVQPIFPIGRLAVTKPAEIKIYLDKVIEQEQVLSAAQQSIGDKSWLKKILHISGGLAEEQAGIKAYVQSMTDEISGNGFGGEVSTFYKTSNDPIQLSAFERVKKAVNEGLSTWMIFGHSSPFLVDFDIGAPENYNNKGRYPFMFIMGCFSGNCSNPIKGLGENFLLARDKGAIAYLATVNFGFTDALHSFGKKFYERMGGADYGGTLGNTIAHTIGSFNTTNYPSLIALLHQMQLQGDPAVRLHRNEGPDYLIDPASVVIDPNPVSIDRASFDLDFALANIGRNMGGKVGIKISQRLPDNSQRLLVTDSVPAPAVRRNLHYTIPSTDNKVGYSRLFIEADPAQLISETPAAAELNNELQDGTGQKGVEVYFYTDDVQPVLPEPFAIVGKTPLRLYASTLAIRSTPLRYLFEIDTSEQFNSPLRTSGDVLSKSGLLQWAPTVALIDSTVYYWRVARDSLVGGDVAWHGSSFIYIKDSPQGWNQSHFGQFVQDEFTTMQLNNPQDGFQFGDDAASYFMNVAYWNNANEIYPGLMNNFSEGITTNYWWGVIGVQRGVVIMQYNPNTGHYIVNPADSDNNPTPGSPNIAFWFDTRDSMERIKLMEFLQHGMVPGAYAGLLTVNQTSDLEGYAPRSWAADSITYGKNLFQVLENMGARDIRKVQNAPDPPYPYGMMFRVGDPDFPVWDTLVYHPDSIINYRQNFAAKWFTGAVESPRIGPARSWASLHWKRGPYDDPAEHSDLQVWGVRNALPDTLLLQLPNTFDTTLTHISAATFPYLKIRYVAVDSNSRTAPQLRYARVLYQGVPEGALNPNALFTFYNDTLQQGETLKNAVAFTNISAWPMDSLLVRYRVENTSGTGNNYFRTYKPLAAGDTLLTSFELPTQTLQGRQRLTVDINPDQHQPELYHFNNVAFHDFYVQRDQRNPLLDVTFDGQHILDGDLISPKPEIILTLKDDNRFLAMRDTSTFRLTLELPDGSTRPIALSDPQVLFFPADSTQLTHKNQARLEWRPEFTQDGTYRLLVNGRDATGNASASLDFAVSFEVITRSSLSNIFNYPNPFSTSTCFVYTMTGAETPAAFKIQIMTVSGRVVREITTSEFGDLQAGTHISNFCWDGKDEYGDQLANGVYLYRVVAKKMDGTDFELFTNEKTDGFFKNGFGKMVLMR